MTTTRICSKCGQKIIGTLDRCPKDGAELISAESMARVGIRVGDYECTGAIGEDGVGAVYSGRHVATGKPFAIKILHDNCARQKEAVDQFIGDMRTASSIRQVNLIDVTDVGVSPDGAVFLATEPLEGESLQARLHRISRLPLFESINIVRQVARGLGAAHEAGLVHGSLKPANIFLCSRKGRRRIVRRSKAMGMRLVVEPEQSFDLVKLLDLGMARFIDFSAKAQSFAGVVDSSACYASPEQVQGKPADVRSDIYALGAVFYQMITGTVPFDGESPSDVPGGQVLISPGRRAPSAGIDGRIDALVLRCLKKSPALRFASTGELCDALEACVTDCAFLRDAHRLPGIKESGIDLSESSPEARQDPSRISPKPEAAPVTEKPAPVATKLAAIAPAAPVATKLAAVAPTAAPMPAPVTEKPAPVAAKPVAIAPTAPVTEKPAPVATKLAAVAPTAPMPAPIATKPAVFAPTAAPMPAPVATKPAAIAPTAPVPIATKPAAPAVLRLPSTRVETRFEPPAALDAPARSVTSATLAEDDPAAKSITPPPTLNVMADDPNAAVATPPPTLNVMADDPNAAVATPPPVTLSLVAPARDTTIPVNQPSKVPVEQPESGRPEPLVKDNDASFDNQALPTWRRPQVIALAGVLLLAGAGIAVWAARRGAVPATPKPTLATQSSPVAVPVAAAPSPARAVTAPAPTAAAPIQPPAAAPNPPPAVAPTEPAQEAPAAVLPTARVVKHETASPRAAVARASHPRRRASRRTAVSTGSESAAESEAAPAPVAATAEVAPEPTAKPAEPPSEPEAPTPSKAVAKPEAEATAPSKVASKPEPTPAALLTVDDLVRDAQQAWLSGHYAAAVSKAQAALKAGAGPAQATQVYEIIGTSSCALHKASSAREAASHLSPDRREAIKEACGKNGVTLDE